MPTTPIDLTALAVGARVQDTFLVWEVETRSQGDGSRFVILTLANASGRLRTAPFWSSELHKVEGLARGAIVRATGDVSEYRGDRQLKVTAIDPVPPGGAAAAALTLLLVRSSDIRVFALVAAIPLLSYAMFKTAIARMHDQVAHLNRVNSMHLATIETLAQAIDARDQVGTRLERGHQATLRHTCCKSTRSRSATRRHASSQSRAQGPRNHTVDPVVRLNAFHI